VSDSRFKIDLAESVAQVPEDVTGQPRRVATAGFQFREIFVALRHRNFRLFFIGQFISLMGTWMQGTAQSWLVYQLTGSKLLLGVVAAAGTAPMLVFSVFGGSLADRLPKRNIILGAQSWMMLLAFVLAGLAWNGAIRPMHLVVIAALSGVALAFDMPARQSFLIELTSRDDLMNAISLNSSIVNGARVVGPAVAGLVMARAGVTLCFFVNGLSYLAVITALLLMKLKPHVERPRAGSAWHHIAEGFRYAWGNVRIRVVLLLFGLVGVFGWSYSVMMPAYATDVLGVQANGYGVLLAASGLGALTGALTVAAASRRIKPRVLVFTGLWVFAAMLMLLSLTRTYAVALCWLVLAGWGMVTFFSTANTVVQTSASDDMRGRIMGIWSLIFGGVIPLGSMETGFISQTFGVPAAIRIGALVCASAGLVTWLFIRRRPAMPLKG
jgi:MFS family permease